MAEFPAKVSTQTSTPEASGRGCMSFLTIDIGFLRSIPGILMMVEIVFGLLVWALIAGSNYTHVPAYGWVMFVAVFFWILTVLLFIFFFLGLHRKIPIVPWQLVMFIYHVSATVLYVTAFITCAASVRQGFYTQSDYNKRAAASFFACLVMIAYGASAYFSFVEWRGGFGSNAASGHA